MHFTSVISVIICVLVRTPLAQYATVGTDLWCQQNHLPETGFAEVHRQFGSSSHSRLAFTEVEKLLEKLMYRVRCEQKSPNQCQCLKADEVFAAVGADRNQGLSEEEFNKASLFLLPSVDRFPANCGPSTSPLCGGDLSQACSVPINSLQGILTRISDTYRPGRLAIDADGKVTEENRYSACLSVRNKMFNAKTVALESGATNKTNGEDISRVSALILSKLLRGQCIVPLNQKSRPVDFTVAIFNEFGNNKTCTIQKEGLDNLLGRVKSDQKALEENNQNSAKLSPSNKHDINDVRRKCFNRSELLEIHQANLTGSGITREEFIRLAPALLQQLSLVACEDDVTEHVASDDKLTRAEMYGYGSIIILIISLGTLPGGLFAPCRDTAAYKYILACMMGMAAGTLLGDGVLHLIPDALGLDITQVTPPHLADTLYVAPYKTKMFLTVAASYLFFVMELIFAYIGMRKEKKKEPISTTFVDGGNKNKYTNGRLGHKGEDNELIERKMVGGKVFDELENDTQEKPNSPMSLAYMILIGDAIHNFADGLAVGAALHVGWRSGLSTSIAIFCHEVPHELGDFAALLSVGWSYKRALIMNFVSGLTAFAGFYVGIAVSDNLYVRQWIFALTAGMFLYIALSDLVPELLEYFRNYSPLPVFVAENLGFMIGMGIMVVITLYEDHIQI